MIVSSNYIVVTCIKFEAGNQREDTLYISQRFRSR
jgi:hypothetical protein